MENGESLYTVLVVEDDELIRENIVSYLNLYKINTISAKDAGEGFELFYSDNISLVITDVNMPDSISGFELVDKLRLTHPELPVIVMSGFNGNKDTAREYSNLTFISKPFNCKFLVQIIKMIKDKKND